MQDKLAPNVLENSIFSLLQFFKILSILLIAAHTLAQTKYLRDCDMSVFCCHEAVLAGNIRVQIFLMVVELFFLFSCEFRVP